MQATPDLPDSLDFPDGIDSVCFDAFGTLVEIGDPRRPFRKLGRLLGRGASNPMTTAMSLAEWAGGRIDAETLSFLEAELGSEVSSIAMRAGMAAFWKRLRRRCIRIGVCSNLAAPYGPPLRAALPDIPDAWVLSYEVGLAKPDPLIFAMVAERLGSPPDRILFVGDTPAHDVAPARLAGMSAMTIAEFEAAMAGTVRRVRRS